MFANVTSKNDRTNEIAEALSRLGNMDVLVGIPQNNDTRKGKDTVTNAELMFIQTHGSPLKHIPARPVIEPAIENDKKIIASILKDALTAALDGDYTLAKENLDKAGLEGQSASQDWFDNPANNWAPNSPITIAKKKSDMPLIDTGQLRKAITFVVRDDE